LINFYHFILWVVGFIEGDTISDMLRRQKERLGIVWWIFPIGTIGGGIWLLLHILEIV